LDWIRDKAIQFLYCPISRAFPRNERCAQLYVVRGLDQYGQDIATTSVEWKPPSEPAALPSQGRGCFGFGSKYNECVVLARSSREMTVGSISNSFAAHS
jgi:hypothetical protein